MTMKQGDYRLAQLLMDRREFLRGMGTVCSAAGVCLLTGCGSGGSAGSAVRNYSAGGRVVLPTGTALSPANLSVVSGGSVTVPSTNGQFSATVYTQEPSLAVLTDAAGNSLLLGFVDPQSNATTMDAASTAVALLFFAIGGPTVPPANKRQILQLLAANAVTAPLASVISMRTGGNPLALQNGDAQITAALHTAYTTLTANVLRAARKAMAAPRMGVAAEQTAPSRAVEPMELLQPTGQQSGIEVVQPTGIVGVQAINHYRRRAQMYIYRVGEVSTGGAATNYPAAVPVGSKLDISATTALGLFTTLDNLFSGLTAFTPVTSPAQTLSLQPNTRQTKFEVVVLGASGSPNPAFFSDPKYSAVSPAWITSVGNLNLFTAIGDMALGFILELWGLRFVITDAAPIQAVLDGLAGLQAQVPTVADLLARARAGKYSEAIADVIELAAKSDIVSSTIKQALKPYILQLEHEAAVGATGTISGKLMSSAFRLLSAAFTPVGITMGLGDLAAIAHDLAISNPGDLWTANLILPTFTLSPTSATSSAGGRVTFSVKLPIGATGSFVFDWSQNSPFSTLSASNGKVSNSLETNDASISVDLVTTPSDVNPITVTVTAFEVDSSGARSPFGIAAAKVTIGAGTVVQAGTRVYKKEYPDGRFTWFAFYTFSPVSGATKYVVKGSNATLTKADIDMGAPVVDQGLTSDPDLTTFVPYGKTGFFNLGGLIGYYVYPGGSPTFKYYGSGDEVLQHNGAEMVTSEPETITIT